MKIVMTKAELSTAIREQAKSKGDVVHYRDLSDRQYALIDHEKWQQYVEIEIVEPRFVVQRHDEDGKYYYVSHEDYNFWSPVLVEATCYATRAEAIKVKDELKDEDRGQEGYSTGFAVVEVA